MIAIKKEIGLTYQEAPGDGGFFDVVIRVESHSFVKKIHEFDVGFVRIS